MERVFAPTITKERLLDAIEDMSDFLDGISRSRLCTPIAEAQTFEVCHLPPKDLSSKRERTPEKVPQESPNIPAVTLGDLPPITVNLPEEEPLELASLSSSPVVKFDNPFQFVTASLQRAPLATLDTDSCEEDLSQPKTDSRYSTMEDKSIQTSPSRYGSTDRNKDVESATIRGQPSSLVELWKGLAYASLSALFFSICSVIVKNLKYMHVTQLGVVRFFGIFVMSFPLAITRDEPLFGTRDTRLMMLIRAVSGATSLLLRFYAFQTMPLGDASTIIFSVPIFVTVMARFFLKEACSVFHVMTCILTIVGIALISKLPMLFGDEKDAELVYGTNNTRIYGVAAALSSCVFAASVIILLRKLKETDPYVIMFNFGWIALALTTASTLVFQHSFVPPKTLLDAGYLVVLGVFSFFGQLMLTFSLRTEQAGPVSVMRATVDIVLVFIWQVVFFHEIPDFLTIVGAVLVMSCVVMTGFRKWALSLPTESNTRRKLTCCL